jgi:flavin-dependent dehydrogenase
MTETDYDVVIIGGGPAGSVAGINLAKSGLNTAIIERKDFPRDTLCGEFLSFEVTNHLKELDLFKKLISLKPNRISAFQLAAGNNKIFTSDLPFEGYSLKRSVLDLFLLDEAKKSGAQVVQPADVKEIKKYRENFILRIKTNEGILNITSNFVIGAYGKSNILDKKLRRTFSEHGSGYNGIKFHLKKDLLPDICDSIIYLFSDYNIYCGINTVSNNEATVCFLTGRNDFNHSPQDHLNNLIAENKSFASLINSLENIDLSNRVIYGSGNIYFGKKDLTPEGIIMIGDAAGVIAPLAGDGIGMAFQSAKIASEIISDFNKNYIGRDRLKHIYRARWKKQFAKRMLIARGIQNIILKEHLDTIPSGIVRFLIPSLISATRN